MTNPGPSPLIKFVPPRVVAAVPPGAPFADFAVRMKSRGGVAGFAGDLVWSRPALEQLRKTRTHAFVLVGDADVLEQLRRHQNNYSQALHYAAIPPTFARPPTLTQAQIKATTHTFLARLVE